MIITHPNKKQQYLSILESVIGLGLVIGPIIGSVIYKTFGYFITFLLFSSLFVFCIILLKYTMPTNIDDYQQETEKLNANQDLEIENTQSISYLRLISDPIILLSIIAAFLSMVTIVYFEPVLAFRLTDFTDSILVQSLVFASQPVGY